MTNELNEVRETLMIAEVKMLGVITNHLCITTNSVLKSILENYQTTTPKNEKAVQEQVNQLLQQIENAKERMKCYL